MPRQEETAELDNTPEEPPHCRWKEGRSVVRPSKKIAEKPALKSQNLPEWLGETTTRPTSLTMSMRGHTTSSTFRDMATSANLMGSEIHEVWEMWTGQKDLGATCCMAKTSPKGICFFRVMPPTELSKIMGLRGIHSVRPCNSGVGSPSVCGAEKKDRIRVWW